jgi:multidrug transporter EmrE-like cation transporter
MNRFNRRVVIPHLSSYPKYVRSISTQLVEMFNIIPLGFASFMAIIDAFVLSWLKEYTLGTTSWSYVLFGAVLYGLQPFVFLKSLQYETMTIMNILWDMISDVTVTSIGLFYFKEKLNSIKMTGLAFAFIAIILLSYDEVSV